MISIGLIIAISILAVLKNKNIFKNLRTEKEIQNFDGQNKYFQLSEKGKFINLKLNKLVDKFNTTRDNFVKAKASRKLGDLCSQLNDPNMKDKAFDFYNRSMQISEMEGDMIGVALGHLKVAKLCTLLSQGELDPRFVAKQNYQWALECLRNVKPKNPAVSRFKAYYGNNIFKFVEKLRKFANKKLQDFDDMKNVVPLNVIKEQKEMTRIFQA